MNGKKEILLSNFQQSHIWLKIYKELFSTLGIFSDRLWNYNMMKHLFESLFNLELNESILKHHFTVTLPRFMMKCAKYSDAR